MDISDTLAPNSDQLDAVDLLGGDRIFTVKSVSKGDAEQPVQVHLAEFPRPWRPGKSMRRVLASCWGTDASVWVGRRVELYCDEKVRFGSEAVGGTRIRRLSHISGKKQVPLLVSRGKSAIYTVEPLSNEPTADEQISSLRAEWKSADADRKKAIEAEVTKLQGGSAPAEPSPPADDDAPAWPDPESQP